MQDLNFNQIREKFLSLWQKWREDKQAQATTGCVALLIIFIILLLPIRAPQSFPIPAVFNIHEGESLHEISANLESRGIIRSPFYFEKLVIIFGLQRRIIAGDYYFEHHEPLYRVIKRITVGDYGLVPLRVTIPEGFNIYQIANLFDHKFDRFDRATFLALAEDKEGYLFPDTYFFLPNIEAQTVIDVLSANFDKKIAEIADEMATSTHTLHETLTMASLLEEEAQTEEDRKIIAGILWKRIKLEMPLQVDATFQYVNGKNTYELTLDDLDIDSPYNTYKYKGLPPAPISNPGLDAIRAAINPTQTKYLYYLSDRKYNIYYARTFDEHKINRGKYLN